MPIALADQLHSRASVAVPEPGAVQKIAADAWKKQKAGMQKGQVVSLSFLL